MSDIRDWDPNPVVLPPEPALEIAPIHGVEPWRGARNPLTRSNTARRVSMTIATPADQGRRKVMLFESNAEFGAALECMLHPDFYDLEAQLPAIDYRRPGRRWQEHYFDLRVTLRSGYRAALYVKADSHLRRASVQDEIAAIVEYTPATFCDEVRVISSARYTRTYISNLLTIWDLTKTPDTALDAHVLETAQRSRYWDIADLLGYCDLPSPALGWQSVMRLIGKHLIKADLYNTICRRSHIWLG